MTPLRLLLKWHLPKGPQEIGPRLTVSSFASAARAPSRQFYFSEMEKECGILPQIGILDFRGGTAVRLCILAIDGNVLLAPREGGR